MSGKLRLLSVLLVAALIVVAGCSMLTPKAYALAIATVTWSSRQDNTATANLGTMIISGMPQALPYTIINIAPLPVVATLSYTPAAGSTFVRWETSGGCSVTNPNAQSTMLTINDSGTVTAVYSGPKVSVGGVIAPTNTLALLLPYVAGFGLVATAAVAVKKRRN